jgi:hypothetical protein
VEAVDGVGGDLNRRMEAEGHLGRRQIVVDRLGHPDDRQALVRETMGNSKGVLAPDGNQGLEGVVGHRLAHARHAAVDLVGVGARRAQDRPPSGEDPSTPLHVQLQGAALDRPSPTVG